MSLTFILDDGHIESIGIDPLGPNAVKDIYILTTAADFRFVACDDGDNDKTFDFFLSPLSFFIYIDF